jgi:hypothetical protein
VTMATQNSTRRWCFIQPGDPAVTEAASYDDAASRARQLADRSYCPVDIGYNDGDGWYLAEVIIGGCPPMRSVAFVRPGTTIMHPLWQDAEPDVLDVTGVSPPDRDGMVVISHTAGAVRVSADMLADEVTAARADLIASVVLDEQVRRSTC